MLSGPSLEPASHMYVLIYFWIHFTLTFLIIYQRTSKSSLTHKLRTKFSLPKLPSSRSRLSSPSTDPTSATPSYHSHPYSAVFTDSEHTYPFSASPGDRSITPEEDPFRKDEVVPPFLANPRLPNSSPRCHFLDNDSEIDKEILGSRPSPMLSRWSSDSESPPSSLNHTLAAGGRPSPFPTLSSNVPRAPSMPLQGLSRSPLSLTFPLPPSALESLPLPGVTVRVTTPTPGPPPAYPPPLIPPPSGPLPCPPLADSNNPSQARLSARLQKDVPRRCSGRDSGRLIPESTPTEQTPGQRPPLWMDRALAPSTPRNVPAPSLREGRRPGAAKLTQQRSAPRRRDRPATPFPLLHPARRLQDPTGRLEASNIETRVSGPREQPAFEKGADETLDSEIEPDRNFDVSYTTYIDFVTPRTGADICTFLGVLYSLTRPGRKRPSPPTRRPRLQYLALQPRPYPQQHRSFQ